MGLFEQTSDSDTLQVILSLSAGPDPDAGVDAGAELQIFFHLGIVVLKS